jgi:hypothetical protein
MKQTIESQGLSKIDPVWLEQLRESIRAEQREGGPGIASEREVDAEENSRFIEHLRNMPYFDDDDLFERVQ